MKQSIPVLLFVLLLVFILNPFGLWMPEMLIKACALGVVLVYAIYALFIYREKARDEREVLHRMIVGRYAFVSTGLVLSIGMAYQAFTYMVDPWLVIALGTMVLTKTVGALFVDKYK